MVLAKRRRTAQPFELRPGDTGLMLTCFRRRENLVSSELISMISSELEEMGSGDDSSDRHETLLKASTIGDAFEQELREMAEQKSALSYRLLGMGDVECIVFAKRQGNRGPAPLPLAEAIWRRAISTGIKYSRYGQRLVPVEMSCRACPEALLELWPRFVESRPDLFQTTKTNGDGICTFAVAVEKRLNDSISKEAVKDLLAAKMVSERGPRGERFIVDLKSPSLTILVQVIKGFLGVSAISQYASLHKSGNIQLLVDAYQQNKLNL